MDTYELGSKGHGLKHARRELPYYPDYETVRKDSEESHVPYRPFTLGYIPQTYEDEKYIVEPARETGNGQPIRAILLNALPGVGEVTKVCFFLDHVSFFTKKHL